MENIDKKTGQPLLYCHTEIICGQRKVSGYMFTYYQMWCYYFLGIQKKKSWFGSEYSPKMGRKLICNAVGLDAAIRKGIY